MLPAQRNKVDISSLNEEEQKLFRLYGKLPTRKDLLGNKLKERKYFDSGDYALSKAGKTPQHTVGTAIPNPETIPHANTVSSPCSSTPTSASLSPGSSATVMTSTTSPIPMPQRANGPQVSAFPTATGAGGSPAKEGSALAREETADDAMQE